MSAEHPVIFSGPMVRAILRETYPKTQTRRVVMPQPKNDGSGGLLREADSWIWHGGQKLVKATYGAPYVHTNRDAMIRAMLTVCPYGQPGHVLYVRETFCVGYALGDGSYTAFAVPGEKPKFFYRATDEDKPDEPQRVWTPSIHMPREACRLLLVVKDVRVERLQDISYQDLLAEGFQPKPDMSDEANRDAARDWYSDLWDDLNAHRGYGWRANPWVYAVEFARMA